MFGQIVQQMPAAMGEHAPLFFWYTITALAALVGLAGLVQLSIKIYEGISSKAKSAAIAEHESLERKFNEWQETERRAHAEILEGVSSLKAEWTSAVRSLTSNFNTIHGDLRALIQWKEDIEVRLAERYARVNLIDQRVFRLETGSPPKPDGAEG